MHKRIIVVASLAASIVAANGLSGQALSDSQLIAIDSAVAAHLRPLLPKTGVVFEPRVNFGGGRFASRSQERITSLSRQLGMTPARTDSVLICGRRPSSCTLRNATTLLTFEDPIVTGDSAIVGFSRHDLSGRERVPITYRSYILQLVREGSRWRVVSSRLSSMS